MFIGCAWQQTVGPTRVFRALPASAQFVWDPASCSSNAGSPGANKGVWGANGDLKGKLTGNTVSQGAPEEQRCCTGPAPAGVAGRGVPPASL